MAVFSVGEVTCLVTSFHDPDLSLLNHVKYHFYLITSRRYLRAGSSVATVEPPHSARTLVEVAEGRSWLEAVPLRATPSQEEVTEKRPVWHLWPCPRGQAGGWGWHHGAVS